MILAFLWSCSTEDTLDSADTGDTAADADTDADTDTDADSDSDSDTDTAAPQLDFVDGPTGYQLDFTYTGTVSEGDRVRCGAWQGADMSGMPPELQDFEASFPSSEVVEIATGTWYAGCYIDFGGGDTAGPGEEDVGYYYGSTDGGPWPIEVYEGKTTVGAYVDFDNATPRTQ